MSFGANDIVKVLVPNVINNGYDYRLTVSADVGDFVSVSVVNKVYIGLIIGCGDSNLPHDKIKSIITKYDFSLSMATVDWIGKMAEWTMMPMGSVLKLILSPADFEKKIRLSKSPVYQYFDSGNVVLNPEQQAAADGINLANFNVHVLDGITGSGKTQVYFDSVLRVYKTGKSVLLMMPEISLTAQFISRFKDKFGSEPVIWHSNLTPAKRHAIWHGVLSGEIKIVVGTRSALFLPWQDLGLIVIDEEHDSSYKQEDMGLYHARDMAILSAKLANFPVVLASATPSFETIKNVLTGKYKMSKLKSRFNGSMLPTIEIVDMRKKK